MKVWGPESHAQKSQAWTPTESSMGGRDGQIPWAHWLASPGYLVSPGPIESVSENKADATWRMTAKVVCGPPHIFLYTCSCMYTHIGTNKHNLLVSIDLFNFNSWYCFQGKCCFLRHYESYWWSYLWMESFSPSSMSIQRSFLPTYGERGNRGRKAGGKRSPFALQVNYAMVRTINLTKKRKLVILFLLWEAGNWRWPLFLSSLIPTEAVYIHSVLSDEFLTGKWFLKRWDKLSFITCKPIKMINMLIKLRWSPKLAFSPV